MFYACTLCVKHVVKTVFYRRHVSCIMAVILSIRLSRGTLKEFGLAPLMREISLSHQTLFSCMK
ncbi:hypothetical protein GBAR_LOCUS30460, partial [Geodia barretti]